MRLKLKFIPVLALLSLLLTVGCQGPIDSVQDAAISAADLSTRATAVTGQPVGWGKDVTGGSGTSVTVDTYSELTAALKDDSKKIIYIDGSIKVTSRITIQDRSNFSIIGKNNARLYSTDTSSSGSGIFYVKRVTNMILQNVTFEGPGAYDTDGWDNLCLDDSQYIWVDHCDFQDGVDGNFDIKNKSDYISVTWCVFQYKKSPIAGGSGGSDDHRYSNLIGSSDSATGDAGKLKVTYYYSRWGQGCVERMPRVRYGQVHILNCLFDSSVSSTSIRAAYKSNVLVEGSYFDNQKKPIDLYSGYTAVKAVNNTGVSNMTAGSTIFTPGYSYQAASASSIVSPIKSNAGATLGNSSTGSSGSGDTSTDTSTDLSSATCSLTVSVSGTSAKLNWSYNNITPSKMIVYRDTDSDPSGRVNIGSATGTSFTDSGLADGTYYYWVKLYVASGDYINSNGDDATISTATPDCSLTVTVSGANAYLNWNYSNFTPSKMIIYRDTDSNPSGRVNIGSATGTSFTDSGLSNGTYYYWVKLYNAAGDIINSNADDAAISVASATAVCNLGVTVSGTSATLKWSYQNFTATTQAVYRDTDSNPSGRVRIGYASGNTFTDTGLSSGQTYYYWIKASDASGTTINSNGDDASI